MINFFRRSEKKLLAVYDLECAAAGYSFIEFMQSAINFKYDNGIEVMDIGIISGSNNGFKNAQFQREANHKIDFANLRVSNIIMPLLNSYSRFINDYFFIKKRNSFLKIKKNYFHTFPKNYKLNIKKKNYNKQSVWSNIEKRTNKTIIASINENKYFKSLIKKKIKSKFITITLREANYNKLRNSHIPSWKRLADRFEKKNFKVIVLRDMEKLYKKDQFIKNVLFPEATIDLNFRVSLYSLSTINLGCSNGPMALSALNNYPTMIWKAGDNYFKDWDSLSGINKFSKKLSKKVVYLNRSDKFENLIDDIEYYAKIKL